MRKSGVAVLLLGVAACKSPSEYANVTPQRPTVSSDTSTTAQGTAELEFGVTVDPGDSVDTPITLSYGAGEATELNVSFSPYQFVEQPGADAEGISDLFVGVRHRFLEETDKLPSTALQLVTKLPTADESEGLGSGEIDFRVAGIGTKTLGDVTATAFYEAGFLGRPNQDDTQYEHTVAVAGGMPLDDHWGAFAELAGIVNDDQNSDQLFITSGATYAVSPSYVLDFGFVLGLTDDAPDFQLLVGVTSNWGASAVPRILPR